jgi:hypothetical protein
MGLGNMPAFMNPMGQMGQMGMGQMGMGQMGMGQMGQMGQMPFQIIGQGGPGQSAYPMMQAMQASTQKYF